MGWHEFLMKHGIGSPGYIARKMAKQYRAIKFANPNEPDRTVLYRVYANRVTAQSALGGPKEYQMSQTDPSLIEAAVEKNPNIFLIIRHAILIEHPGFHNPFAPADRFEVLDRVLAQVLDRQIPEWRHSPVSLPLEDRGCVEGELGWDHSKDGAGWQSEDSRRPRGGDSLDTALKKFVRACKEEPGTLFITDEWVQPRIHILEGLLSDPITADEASALTDSLLRRAKLDHVIEWLADSDLQWQEFIVRKKELESRIRSLEAAQERVEYERQRASAEMAWRTKANSPWEAAMRDVTLQSKHDPEPIKREFGKLAHPCAKCGSNKLTWFYYIQPPGEYRLRGMHKFSGWVTACEPCGIVVDYLGTEFRMRAEARGGRVMY